MNRRDTVLLIGGWVCLGVGIWVAQTMPARGYELSLYGNTPIGFWIAISVAMGISIWTVLSPSLRTAVTGGALGVSGVVAIMFLPVIRGYHYLGIADPITHLGFARDLSTGAATAVDLPYPGVHLLGITIGELAGIDLQTGLLLGGLGIMTTFFFTVPLLVREISPSPVAVGYALLIALLLLPVNGVSVHPRVHPFTQMVFFTPLFLYALVQVKRSNRPEWVAAFLGIAGGVLVYHAQVALALALFALIVAAVDYSLSKSTLVPVGFESGRQHILSLSVAFLVLSVTYTLDLLARLLSSLAFRLFVVRQTTVEERVDAATELGVDPLILVLRTGAPAIVLSVIALLAIGVWTRNRTNPWTGYFAVGSVAFAFIGGLYVLAGQINQFTRYASLGLVIVAVLAPLGLAAIDDQYRPRFGTPSVRTVAVVAFCLLLLASVPAMFIGPYTERPNQHITEAMVDGTETAFEYDDGETPYYGINIDRFDDAIYGASADRIGNDERAGVGELEYELRPEVLENLENDQYLLLTTYQYEQDVTLHGGVRNSESDYERLDAEPFISRLSSGEETTLYRVSSE